MSEVRNLCAMCNDELDTFSKEVLPVQVGLPLDVVEVSLEFGSAPTLDRL